MSSSHRTQWNHIDVSLIEDLARKHETPLYLYDADTVAERVQGVRNAFEGLACVYFAVKANPNLELLRSLRNSVDGLDISSGGELEQAVLAGHAASSLSFAGPAKSAEELAAAVRQGVGCISVESRREIDGCIEAAKQCNRRANVVVRVNPRFLNRAFGMKMGGRAAQFGIDEEELGDALEVVASAREWLDFRGLHVYAGSQCFDVEGAAEGIRDTLRIAMQAERDSGLRCGLVNLGGGFGVSHNEAGRAIQLADLGRELVPTLREFIGDGPNRRTVLFELGRYLVADAGLYVTRVIGSKRSRGKLYFMLDGGLHHHLAAAGTFGTALRGNFVLENLTRPDAPPVRCQLAGPSCNPTDLLGVDVDLPHPEPGDLIGVLKSGSYGLTASPVLFLGRRTPVELVIQAGRVTVGRRSMSVVDFN